MNARSLSRLTIIGCLLLGGIFIGLRYQARSAARTELEDSLWRLTYDIHFTAEDDGATVRIYLPDDTQHMGVTHLELSHPNLRLEPVDPEAGTNSRVVSTRRGGEFQVIAEVVLRHSPRLPLTRRPRYATLSAESRARYLRSEENIPSDSESVQSLVQDIQVDKETRSEQVQWAFDFCAHDISSPPREASDNAVIALETGVGSPLARARAMVALCRAMRIPSRLVTGFEIKQQSEAAPRVWVELFQKQQWVPFGPDYGFAYNLPSHFVPVRRGGDSPLRAPGIGQMEAKYSIVRLPPAENLLQSELRTPAQILDLTRLPLEMHHVMSLMLLLPLGALITALMRNLVGIKTFGTFAPALLALSFIYANWGTGVIILVVVVLAGLVGRYYLERLQLLMVPRLSIVLTLAIVCVVFGVSLWEYLNPTQTAQTVLLPLVIITILLERFYVTSEEDGMFQAITLVIGTAVVSLLCYLLLRWDDVGNFMLNYPETHFITIAAFIMVGRYAGYRLTELWRFRDVADIDDLRP